MIRTVSEYAITSEEYMVVRELKHPFNLLPERHCS